MTSAKDRKPSSHDVAQVAGGRRYSGTLELQQTEVLKNYNRFICDLIRRQHRSGIVVDFGAGTGTLADQMSELGEIWCVEIDPSLSETLRSKGYKVYPNLELLEDDSVALVYSSNVLEHLEDDLSALKGVYRKLHVGGRVALFVPAFERIWTANDDRVGHKRRYTRDTLSECVRGAGFRIESVCYVDSIGFLLAYLYRYLGSRDGRLSTGQLVIFDRVIFPVSRVLDLIVRNWFGKNLFLVARK